MQQILIGLLQSEPGWEILLQQIGVPYEVVDRPSRPNPHRYSVLVANRELAAPDARRVQDYLAQGGAVLARTDHFVRVQPVPVHADRIEYIFPDQSQLFEDVDQIDLAGRGWTTPIANCGRLPGGEHALVANAGPGGTYILLPFDLNREILSQNSRRKAFVVSRTLPRPTEKVNIVSKGEIRRLLLNCLIHLHQTRGLPFVHLWYYPDRYRTSFGLRVDVDRAGQASSYRLFQLAQAQRIRIDWFASLKEGAHVECLMQTVLQAGHNVGLHGHEHRVFDELDANLINIKTGLESFRHAGLPSAGFTAPHVTWNEHLAASLDAAGINYSSEFGLDYDDLPFWPATGRRRFKHLQLPIHPVCIGRLARCGYHENEMGEYFRIILDRCIRKGHPAFFYHHPAHGHEAVLGALFQLALRHQQVQVTTMKDLYEWWQKRAQVQLRARLCGARLELKASRHAPQQLLRIVHANREAFVPLRPSVHLGRCRWEVRPARIRVPLRSARIALLRRWQENLSDWLIKRIRR